MSNVLLDTNVLIYAVDEDSKYFDQAQYVITDPGLALYTTSKNLSEFLSVVTRARGNALPIRDALLIVNDFFNLLNVLYPTDSSYQLLLNLLEVYEPVGLQIHDFEMAGIGLAHGINQIVTFNKKDFALIKEITLYPL
jgi:predicted nucleic acid-binding protein